VEKLTGNILGFFSESVELDNTMDLNAPVAKNVTRRGSSFQESFIHLKNSDDKKALPWNTVLEPKHRLVSSNCLNRKALYQYQILIVDDNPVNCMYLGELCRIWNIGYEFALDGKTALGMIKQNEYHLVILDIHMPEMDGYSLTRKIRSQESSKSNLPIVALTADILSCGISKVISAGMDDYLPKPFKPQQLFDILSNYFQFSGGTDTVLQRFVFFNGESEWIDYNNLIDLYGNDVEHMVSMFLMFLKNTPREFQKLLDYYRLKNLPMLAEQAHKIRPTFAMVGIKTVIIEAFTTIEAKAKSSQYDQQLRDLMCCLEEKTGECFRDLRREYNWIKVSTESTCSLAF
jgi:CheY-like chemotaxis protein